MSSNPFHSSVIFFSNFSCIFLNPNTFFPIWILIVLIYWICETSSNKLKKVFSFQKLFWPSFVQKNCSSDLKLFATSWPSASNFKCFSQSLEQFFLTVCQNKFGDKIPISMNLSFFSHYPRSSISWIFHKNAGTYMKMIMPV